MGRGPLTAPRIIPVYRFALILASLLPAAADEVLLADGSRLSGTVTALSDSGQVALASPLSLEPFLIRSDHVRHVVFSRQGGTADEHDALAVLANGDEIPCDLRGIDADSVQLATSFAGELDVPRSALSTLQLGVRPREVVFRGPADAEGWDIHDGWRFDSGRFAADGSGTLARTFDIPGSFAFRFRLAWRNNPNIQVYFADDKLETVGKANRYYVTFNVSGLGLKRQQDQNEGQNWLDMASIPRDPSDFPDSSVEIELRVDRKLALVHIYLDGELVEKCHDPLHAAPSGQGIMFRSNVGGDETMFIDRIEIREWDPSADRHRAEPRGDEDTDVVITRRSDRGKGRILGTGSGPEGLAILYKGPHTSEPVKLPAEEVSTLFFQRPEGAEPAPRPPLSLALRGRGSLGVTACTLAEDGLRAEHPLLGTLSIRKEAVSRLERKPAGDEEQGEDEEEEK